MTRRRPFRLVPLVLAVGLSLGALADLSTAGLLLARGPERIKPTPSSRQVVASVLAGLSDAARSFQLPQFSHAAIIATRDGVVGLADRNSIMAGGQADPSATPMRLRPSLTDLPPPFAAI